MGYFGMDYFVILNDVLIFQVLFLFEVFEGFVFVVDVFVGVEKMVVFCVLVVCEVSGMFVFWFQVDCVEYCVCSGKDGYFWDVQGYYGGDFDKFWFKSEGEGSFGEKLEVVEVQGFWSYVIGFWWDL